jgi:hypothetical protein
MKLIPALIIVSFLSISGLKSIAQNTLVIAPSDQAVVHQKLEFMRKLLKDPMVSDKADDVKFTLTEKPDSVTLAENMVRVGYIFDIQFPPKNKNIIRHGLVGVIVTNHKDAEINFSLRQLTNNVNKHIDWEDVQHQLDMFINKHWAGLQRINAWQDALQHFSPGMHQIVFKYALTKEGVELLELTARVNLTDGKIAGISVVDSRPYVTDNIPPAPDKAMLRQSALVSLHDQQITSVSDLSNVVIKRRYFSIGNIDSKSSGFYDEVVIQGKNEADMDVYLAGVYNEKRSSMLIEKISQEPNKTEENYRPNTIANDTAPHWSVDGKLLYFSSTRDSHNRPWWTRYSLFSSIAMLPLSTQSSIKLLRPFKSKGSDTLFYEQPQLSPSKKQMALTYDHRLVISDLISGITYLPSSNGTAIINIVGLNTYTYKTNLTWDVQGCAWINDKQIIVSSTTGGDHNLYLAKWTTNPSQNQIEVVPLFSKPGEDRLPHYLRKEKKLVWCHEVLPGQGSNADPSVKWQMVFADFDADNVNLKIKSSGLNDGIDPLQEVEKNNVTNIEYVNLPDEPTSISWDVKNGRWLIVTRKNNLLWIKKKGNKLVTTKVLLPLTWNDSKLRPTSAAVSPDGTSIALAAELEKPIAYPKTECVIHSMIFNWDGKSTSVKSFYDPSINGIPRYIFPATNSQWAKVEGNVKKFGLESTVDPDSVESASVEPQAATK